MPIRIKNDQTERLARQLAELTGESFTEAIRGALAVRYDRLRRERSGRSLADELREIAVRCANRPIVSQRSDEEILGYHEAGIPTRWRWTLRRFLRFSNARRRGTSSCVRSGTTHGGPQCVPAVWKGPACSGIELWRLRGVCACAVVGRSVALQME